MPFPHRENPKGKEFLSGNTDSNFDLSEEGKQKISEKITYQYEGHKLSKDSFELLKFFEEQVGKKEIIDLLDSRAVTLDEKGNIIFLNLAFVRDLTEFPDTLPDTIRKVFLAATPIAGNFVELRRINDYCIEHNIILAY